MTRLPPPFVVARLVTGNFGSYNATRDYSFNSSGSEERKRAISVGAFYNQSAVDLYAAKVSSAKRFDLTF
jgi:hypothetical protein